MASDDSGDVDARLRAALVTADQLVGRDGVDMSSAAVTNRIREAAEMSTLCLELMRNASPSTTRSR